MWYRIHWWRFAGRSRSVPRTGDGHPRHKDKECLHASWDEQRLARETCTTLDVIISALPASAVGRSLHARRCVTTSLLARLACVHAPWRPCTRCTLALHHIEHFLRTAATVYRVRIERRLRRWRGRPQVD